MLWLLYHSKNVSVNVQNIIHRQLHTVLQYDQPLVIIELLYCTGYRQICAAVFAIIWLEVGECHLRCVSKLLPKKPNLRIQHVQRAFLQLNLIVRQPSGFFDCIVVSGESRKGRKLRRTV